MFYWSLYTFADVLDALYLDAMYPGTGHPDLSLSHVSALSFFGITLFGSVLPHVTIGKLPPGSWASLNGKKNLFL